MFNFNNYKSERGGEGKIQISELAVPGFELEGGKGLDYNASSADDSRSTYIRDQRVAAFRHRPNLSPFYICM